MPPTIRGSFTDADGTQPDFAAHWAVALEAEYGPLGEPL
ncbi:hypothetical protein J2S55_008029 [Streptosporangium brasiliense]|uniref:Uncharacterized protein n=1 Tax=Streptosporangium brasiliense TaxID=47480 RepID=A0ABT9RI54_9ACTN|nr:hypothetical protein [Streptosporangium brasiliense]